MLLTTGVTLPMLPEPYSVSRGEEREDRGGGEVKAIFI